MAVSLFRCIAIYFSVVLAVRVMGKRQIGELQPSELVITIMISELAALPLQELNMPLLWGIMPMFMMVGLELLMSLLALKSMKFRKLFYGKPIFLIYDGKVNQYELLRTRVSMEDIMEAMRGSGLLAVEEVQIAVLETNGTVSVIPKPSAAPPTASDLKIKTKGNGGIPLILVMNGQVVEDNLQAKQMSQKELNVILNGYMANIKDVFMLTIDDAGKTSLIKKEGT